MDESQSHCACFCRSTVIYNVSRQAIIHDIVEVYMYGSSKEKTIDVNNAIVNAIVARPVVHPTYSFGSAMCAPLSRRLHVDAVTV